MNYSDYEALKLVIWYDGYDEALSAIADDMKKFLEDPNETYKNHYSFFRLKEVFHSDNALLIDNELMMFWSYLVLKFGSYGTSPRVGWIEDIDECISYIKELCSSPAEEEYIE